MDEMVVRWHCKRCTHLHDAVVGSFTCAVCGTDHSQDEDVLNTISLLAKTPPPPPPSPPAPPLSPPPPPPPSPPPPHFLLHHHLHLPLHDRQKSSSSSNVPPEDCQVFPKQVDKNYLREYYRHNLTKWVPLDLQVPMEVVHFIVHQIEESFNIGDILRKLVAARRVEDGWDDWD
eukprot:TRINITY_DN14791_c0_g1_i2.p1 TRINITY_DN14791_c0_g1~~TRINITY_DN14791_c0_g1_i2.p1  ORF type:complete len:174 (-),score=28.12 TRINITY_DN14791_c0_g1_i2:170-691(-)